MDNKERLIKELKVWQKDRIQFPVSIEALVDRIAAANLLAPEWISVKERLPDGGNVDELGNAERMVLAYSPNPPFDWGGINFMVYNPGAFTMKIRPEAVDKITHTMALPAAPKDNHDER